MVPFTLEQPVQVHASHCGSRVVRAKGPSWGKGGPSSAFRSSGIGFASGLCRVRNGYAFHSPWCRLRKKGRRGRTLDRATGGSCATPRRCRVRNGDAVNRQCVDCERREARSNSLNDRATGGSCATPRRLAGYRSDVSNTHRVPPTP
jgi:hypothetical protein